MPSVAPPQPVGPRRINVPIPIPTTTTTITKWLTINVHSARATPTRIPQQPLTNITTSSLSTFFVWQYLKAILYI
ncbi:unnamed protein product [Rotaria socialis]|uniref:Uncharacterized protein n=1 Tax=Rotaria socialis TaxID=392032 RepID=A0A820UNS2_9BILA|nr:unnamed protein product [Rotaria socialis]CAF3509700.1 unnamed protein product [Rotaria socialis]CAF4417494.1 unnamed protein product [Rotaria socialis]CAF4488025.1 unnamed protein product [Rotaria socialis]